MRFTIRQLEVFVTLAQTEHFGRAADFLGLAQPTVSSDLRSLERALGLQLFNRSRAGTTLTTAGADLLPQAQAVLSQAQKMQTLAASWAHGSTEVRLAASPSLINRLIPTVLQEVAGSHPHLQVITVEVPTGGVHSAVAEGTAEVGLGHFVERPAGTTRGTIGHDELRILAAPQVLDDEPVDLNRLSARRLLLWPREQNPEYYDAIVAACRSRGWDGDVIETPTRFTGPNSYRLTSGEAFSIVPADFALTAPATLASRPLSPVALVPLHALWREPVGDGVRSVLQVLLELRT